MIIETVLGGLLLYAAIEGGLAVIQWGYSASKRYFTKHKYPELFQDVQLSDKDKEMIEKCRELLKETFPEGIEARIKDMSADERMALIRELIEKCNAIYDLDITKINFMSAYEIGGATCGCYQSKDNSITLNIDLISFSDPTAMGIIINTIFHEMRHAQQYRAITTEGYSFGTDEQAKAWAINFSHYIRAEVDMMLYQLQAVEADANRVADEITKELKIKEE